MQFSVTNVTQDHHIHKVADEWQGLVVLSEIDVGAKCCIIIDVVGCTVSQWDYKYSTGHMLYSRPNTITITWAAWLAGVGTNIYLVIHIMYLRNRL